MRKYGAASVRERGKGSPVPDGADLPVERAAPLRRAVKRLKARVVIVDDNTETARLVADALRRAYRGIEAVAVSSPIAGSESPSGAPPDCVLLDYDAASVSGIESLHRVRERWPDVPLIVITGAISKGIAVPAAVPLLIAGVEQRRCLGRVVSAVREICGG